MFKLITKTYEAHGYSAKEAQVTGKALAQVRKELVKVIRMTEAEVQAWEGNQYPPTVEDLEELEAPFEPAWMEQGLTLADLTGTATRSQEASLDAWAAHQINAYS